MDTVKGIERLNKKFVTAMLSNGNTEILDDLQQFGKLGFREKISAAEFGGCEFAPFYLLLSG